MLEYVLFSEHIRNKFVDWLINNQVEYQLAGDTDELLVLISEDIDESIEDKIEELYDLLLDESAQFVDEDDNSNGSTHVVGIQYSDKNGEISQVTIPPELANQIQQCLSPGELQSFVQLIVDAVNDPYNRPLCQV